MRPESTFENSQRQNLELGSDILDVEVPEEPFAMEHKWDSSHSQMPTEFDLDPSSADFDGPSMQLSSIGDQSSQGLSTQESSELDGHLTASEAS